MSRKSAVAASLQNISIKNISTDESLQSFNSMNFLSSVSVKKSLKVDSTDNVEFEPYKDEIYYVYFDNGKFKLSDPFDNEIDTSIANEYNFKSNRVINLYVGSTYRFIMKETYVITNNQTLNNTMNERFLIWLNRNYSNTMDVRLRNPNSLLGDPTGITYYSNNILGDYDNYVSINTSSELRFIPYTHETLYYFSTLTKNAGTRIDISPRKFAKIGSTSINGGVGITGNVNIGNNMLLKTDHFKVIRDDTNDISVGIQNNRTKLDLGALKGAIVIPKGNKLSIGYNHLQKYGTPNITTNNTIIELELENTEFVNLIIIKKEAFDNINGLTLNLKKLDDNETTTGIVDIFQNDNLIFDQNFYSKGLTYWPDTNDPQTERNYTQCYKKRFHSIQLKKIQLIFNQSLTNLNILDNIEIWKLGEKPPKTKGILRFNIESQSFEGQFSEEPSELTAFTQQLYESGTNNWPSIGGIKDIDLDTFVETTTDINFFTGNNNPSNTTQRMFIKENDDLTKIGIGDFSTPQATLDIKGNLNIENDNAIGGGVNIGHNTENSVSDYLNVNIVSNSDESIYFNCAGNYNIDLQKNYIIDVNDSYIIKSNNLNKFINNFNSIKVINEFKTSIGANKNTKINLDYNINNNNNLTEIINQHNITVQDNFNSVLNNNKIISLSCNLNKNTKNNSILTVNNTSNEVYKNNYNSFIHSNLNTNINNDLNKIIHGNNTENIYKNKNVYIQTNKTSNVNNNNTKNINSLDITTDGTQNLEYKKDLNIKNQTFNTDILNNSDNKIIKDKQNIYLTNVLSNINDSNNIDILGSYSSRTNSHEVNNIKKNKNTYIAYGNNKSRTLTVNNDYNITTNQHSTFNYDQNEYINVNNNLKETYDGTVKWDINSSTMNINKSNFMIIDKNYHKTIKNLDINVSNNSIETINSNNTLNISHNSTQNIHKNYNSNIFGTNKNIIQKNINQTFNKNVFINVGLNNTISVLGNNNIIVKQDSNSNIDQNYTINTINDSNTTTEQNFIIYGNTDNQTFNTNTIIINDNLNKTYKSIHNLNYYNNKILTINTDSNETYKNNLNKNILQNSNLNINNNYTSKIYNNLINKFELNKDNTIYNNSNLTVGENFNTLIHNNLITNITHNLNINNDSDVNLNKFNIYENISQSNTLNVNNIQKITTYGINNEIYNSNLNKNIIVNHIKNINQKKSTTIFNNDIQTYKNSVIIKNTLNKTEQYSSYYNSNVGHNRTINITKSDYNIDIQNSKDLNLKTNTGGSTILDNVLQHNNLLYTKGGTLVKKDLWIGQNLNITGNFNATNGDLAQLQVEEVVIDNPMLLIGQSSTQDEPISGLINRYSSNNKFTGLIKNNTNTLDYGLIYNIDADNNDITTLNESIIQEKITSKNDKNSFANLTIDKLNVLNDTLNDDLKTLGSLNIAKNMFIGNDNDNNSKIKGTHYSVQKSNNDFKINAEQPININTTDSKNIDLISKKQFTKTISGNNTINIQQDFVQNTQSNNYFTIKQNSNETYNKDYNTTLGNNSYLNINDSKENIIKGSTTININGNLIETINQHRYHNIDNNLFETYSKNKQILKEYKQLLETHNSNIQNNNNAYYGLKNTYIVGNDDLEIFGNSSQVFTNHYYRSILKNNNLNYNKDNNLNIDQFNLSVHNNSNELHKQKLVQHINNYTIIIDNNNNITKKNNNDLLIDSNNTNLLNNKKLNIHNNSNIIIKGNNTENIFDNSDIKLNKNNTIITSGNILNNINNNNYKFINGNDTKILKSNNSIKILNNKSTTYNTNLNKFTKNNVVYDINNSGTVFNNSSFTIKSLVSNWQNKNLSTNINDPQSDQFRYIIAVKYQKNSIVYKTTLAAANIDNIDNIKDELKSVLNLTESEKATIEVITQWYNKLVNNKIQIYTTFSDTLPFYLGQYGTNSTMPLLNLNNNANIDLSSGFDITGTDNNLIFNINDFNLAILDSHTPLEQNNLNVYGNGLASSSINIAYFTDTDTLTFYDKTPAKYTQHITNNNLNNYNKLNATGTNYNIETFDRNTKTNLSINSDHYKDGNSFIFDIDKNAILDGNVNINNLSKPGFDDVYNFNKSITTPFTFTFNTNTNAQYNINNWLFPLNSENNNNEGRIFSQNDYFAFNLEYNKITDTIPNLSNCPKRFDIYGITSEKDFTLFDINTSKSLLTPNIKTTKLISETPNNLKLTQGITDIDKSINNIDITNQYISKNNYANTLIDLSFTTSNADIDSAFTYESTNYFKIDTECYIGNGSDPIVVQDPLHNNNKVILLTDKGMKYKVGTNNDYGLLDRDKFSLELYFNLIYSSNTYKHYIYSQSNNDNKGFNIYISNGDIYIRLSQGYDDYTEHIINFTNFIDNNKINYDKWYHFVFTKNINQISVFLNGKRYSINSISEYNHVSLFSYDLYHHGAIGASKSTVDGNEIVPSLNGYITDFKAYNGYIIHESDFIPTERNCLLKLDIHKYIDSNNYYTNYNKNILIDKKNATMRDPFPDGHEFKDENNIYELPDHSNNNNNFKLHWNGNLTESLWTAAVNGNYNSRTDSADPWDNTLPGSTPGFPSFNRIERGINMKNYGFFKVFNPTQPLRTVFIVIKILEYNPKEYSLPVTNAGGPSMRTPVIDVSMAGRVTGVKLNYMNGYDENSEPFPILMDGTALLPGALHPEKSNGELYEHGIAGEFGLHYTETNGFKSYGSDYVNNNAWVNGVKAPNRNNAVNHITGDGTGIKLIIGYRARPGSEGNSGTWRENVPSYQLFINQSFNTPASGFNNSILYDVITYSDVKSDADMVAISEYLNKKHSAYIDTTTNDYSSGASDTLPVTDNLTFKFDGKELLKDYTRNSININGIEDKTIHLIKNTQYNFICDNPVNDNYIFSIVNDISHKFTTDSNNRLGAYNFETTTGTELDKWNNSSTRSLVWTPIESGTYYYYSWNGTDNSTKHYGGIIIVYDSEPQLNDIICTSNNKTTINNEALPSGNKVVVSSTKFKQHDYSLYFNKSVLSMQFFNNNIKGFKTDINSIQFWAYINNNTETNSILFSQRNDNLDTNVLLEVLKAANSTDTYSSLKLTHNNNEIILNTPNIDFNVWTHFAYVRYYNLIYLYINGKRYSSVSSNNLSVNNSYSLYLGHQESNGILNQSITSIKNLEDNNKLALKGTRGGTETSSLRNDGTRNYIRLHNFIRITTPPNHFKTVFAVFKMPELAELQSKTEQHFMSSRCKLMHMFHYFAHSENGLSTTNSHTLAARLETQHTWRVNPQIHLSKDGNLTRHTDQKHHINGYEYDQSTTVIADHPHNFHSGHNNQVDTPHHPVAFGSMCLIAFNYTEHSTFTDFIINASFDPYDRDLNGNNRGTFTTDFVKDDSNFTPDILNLYELLIYGGDGQTGPMSQDHMRNIIKYLNKKHKVFTSDANDQHLYDQTSNQYSQSGDTTLPVTANLKVRIDATSTVVDSYLKGYMDNIEVYDNTLLYNDILNVKERNNNLYINNTLNNINLFNNKHLLFNFDNLSTKALFESNSNIGLTPISTSSTIAYNLPIQNDLVLKYNSSNTNTNSLYLQNIVTDNSNNYQTINGTYTNNLASVPTINYSASDVPIINLFEGDKLSIELNTTQITNAAITMRNNNNIVNSHNILTSFTYPLITQTNNSASTTVSTASYSQNYITNLIETNSETWATEFTTTTLDHANNNYEIDKPILYQTGSLPAYILGNTTDSNDNATNIYFPRILSAAETALVAQADDSSWAPYRRVNISDRTDSNGTEIHNIGAVILVFELPQTWPTYNTDGDGYTNQDPSDRRQLISLFHRNYNSNTTTYEAHLERKETLMIQNDGQLVLQDSDNLAPHIQDKLGSVYLRQAGAAQPLFKEKGVGRYAYAGATYSYGANSFDTQPKILTLGGKYILILCPHKGETITNVKIGADSSSGIKIYETIILKTTLNGYNNPSSQYDDFWTNAANIYSSLYNKWFANNSVQNVSINTIMNSSSLVGVRGWWNTAPPSYNYNPDKDSELNDNEYVGPGVSNRTPDSTDVIYHIDASLDTNISNTETSNNQNSQSTSLSTNYNNDIYLYRTSTLSTSYNRTSSTTLSLIAPTGPQTITSIKDDVNNTNFTLRGTGTSSLQYDGTHYFMRLNNFIRISTLNNEYRTVFMVFRQPTLAQIQAIEATGVNHYSQATVTMQFLSYFSHGFERGSGEYYRPYGRASEFNLMCDIIREGHQEDLSVRLDRFGHNEYISINGHEPLSIPHIPSTEMCIIAFKTSANYPPHSSAPSNTPTEYNTFMINASLPKVNWSYSSDPMPDVLNDSNFTSHPFDLYEVLAYGDDMPINDIRNIIKYLNRKYKAFTSDPTHQHLWDGYVVGEAGGPSNQYSPNAATSLPTGFDLKLHITPGTPTNLPSSFSDSNPVSIFFNNNFNNIIKNKIYFGYPTANTNMISIKENISDSTFVNIPDGSTTGEIQKINSLEKLSTINTIEKNTLTIFKKYIVTEINHEYYIDGIANKFIELNRNDTIIFDLSALNNYKTKFKIVDNNFNTSAQATANDTNFVFNYTGTENTLYYIKEGYMSKNTLHFGSNGNNIVPGKIYHCFTGCIYNVPDNVVIIYEPTNENENIINNEFKPRLPGKYQLTYNNTTVVVYVSFGREIRIKNHKLNVNDNDIYIINNYNNSSTEPKNSNYIMNSSSNKLFGGINLWGMNFTEEKINNITLDISTGTNTISIYNNNYLNFIKVYHNQSNPDNLSNIDSVKELFLTTKKSNTFTFNTDFNIIASIGNSNSTTPYRFNNDMTYNLRAEFDNFPKSWKIYGCSSKTFTMNNNIGLTDKILLAEQTCNNKQLDSNGFINNGSPFYYNKLNTSYTDIYWIQIQITEIWDDANNFNLSGFYTQINTGKEFFKGSIKKLYSSASAPDMSSDSSYPHNNNNLSDNTKPLTKDDLYNKHYLLSKYNESFNNELFYWYYMIIYAHNSAEVDPNSHNLGIKFDEFIPKLDNLYFNNILSTRNNITGPNYNLSSIEINNSSISLNTDNYNNGNAYLLYYDSGSNILSSSNSDIISNTAGFSTEFSLNNKVLNLGYNSAIPNSDRSRSIWIIPLNDAENSKTGRILTSDDKFAFKINDINKAPIRYDIFAISTKDITLDNLGSVTPRLSLSGTNIVKLHENNYYNTNKFNTLTGNHIIQTYSESFSAIKAYWLIIGFYGVNSPQNELSSNILSFDEFKIQTSFEINDNTNTPLDRNLTDTQRNNINKFNISYTSTPIQNQLSINGNYDKMNKENFETNIGRTYENYINNNENKHYNNSVNEVNENNLISNIHGYKSSINYNLNQTCNKNNNMIITNNLDTLVQNDYDNLVGGHIVKNINNNLDKNVDSNYKLINTNDVNSTHKNNYLSTTSGNLLNNVNYDNNVKITGSDITQYNNTNNMSVYGTTTETYNQIFNSTVSNNLTIVSSNDISNTINSNLNIDIGDNMDSTIDSNNTIDIKKDVSKQIDKNKNRTIYGNSIETINSNFNKIIDKNQNIIINGENKRDVTSNTLNYYNQNHTITINNNNNNIIDKTYNINVKNNSDINILGNSHITSSLTSENMYDKEVQQEFKNTFYNKINQDDNNILESNSNIHISNNLDETIKTKNTSIFNNVTKEYNKNYQKQITGNLNKTVYGTSNIVYSKDVTSRKGLNQSSNNITISKDSNTTITESNTLTVTNDINIKTDGGFIIEANSNRSLDFMGNTCIKEIKSLIPNIINTQLLFNSISTDGNEDNQYLIDPLKTVNIIAISDTNNLSTTYNNTDMFIRVKLLPGKYNGQICKIVLHPQFETIFNNTTIDQRISQNYSTEVIVRIDSFVDSGTNEFVSVDLVLNRGGMSINLIYVSTTTNTDSLLTNDTKPYSALNDPNNDDDLTNDVDDRGYWMLLDNNFNTVD